MAINLKHVFQEYLKQNYVVSDAEAEKIARGMEYDVQVNLLQTVVSDNGLIEK